jgi:hypothetical protein
VFTLSSIIASLNPLGRLRHPCIIAIAAADCLIYNRFVERE